jgi:mono/diheme cytochrome c family protein
MRERQRWFSLGVASAFLIAVNAREGTAQSAHAHDDADTLTTQSGVYTFQQSNRGSDVYAGNCRSCHTPDTHTGPVFHAIWNGRSIADLYVFIRDRMPKNDPGALSPEEYIDIVAYLLRMNRLPMGESELSADSASLSKIRIVLRKP